MPARGRTRRIENTFEASWREYGVRELMSLSHKLQEIYKAADIAVASVGFSPSANVIDEEAEIYFMIQVGVGKRQEG